jgi:prepilin-type N-terminal cleavage/methylation domain-containing protein
MNIIKIKLIRRTGLTLIELMVVTALASICMLAVGVVFCDSQKAWNGTYTKANSSIMLDSQLASKAFEAAIRKASCEKYSLDTAGRWVEVYYFASETSTTTDRYARLYLEGGTFYIECGILDPRQTLYTNPICNNVTAFSFSGSGRCIRMKMTLSDNSQDVNCISSAVPQNQ